jgi:microcystin-dependent protein
MAFQAFLGSIHLFAGNFAPQGFAFCNGQILAINQNTALFSLLGTQYGGNGTSTFALPDLRGRSPIGAGQGPGLTPFSQGDTGGSENASLTIANLPGHAHSLSIPASTNPGTTATPGPSFVPARSTAKDGIYTTGANTTLASPDGTSVVGNNAPFEIRPPFLCVSYIIALVGIFPSRN